MLIKSFCLFLLLALGRAALIARYSLDEGAGTSVADSSGLSKADGTVSGSFSWVADGGNAAFSGEPSLRFTGNQAGGAGLTLIPSIFGSPLSDAMTFTAWIKFNANLGGYTTIIDTSPRQFAVWLGGATAGGWSALGAAFPSSCLSAQPTTGWHFLQVSQSTTAVTVYLDEALACSDTFGPSSWSITTNVVLGTLNPSGGGNVNTSPDYEMQDVRFYDTFASSALASTSGMIFGAE